MKEKYVDLMEKVLSAYSDEDIRLYIEEIKKNGVTEHGFPRLTANIGFLVALGRRRELIPTLFEMMDLCCAEGLSRKSANEFSVRELCTCLMLLEKSGVFPHTLMDKWKGRLREFDYRLGFTIYAQSPDLPVSNWGAFAALSEFVRGKYLGVDTGAFVDTQIASQLLSFDKNGMYKDNPGNPMVYDLITRTLLSALLSEGYCGKYSSDIERLLSFSDELTLSMQSVSGEVPFGGRSNQFLHNEAALCYYCEMAAARYYSRGDTELAGRFKSAAGLALNNLSKRLDEKVISHVKNHYPRDSFVGCEKYAYFNKYMITASSMLYFAYHFACDEIIPTEKGNKAEVLVLSPDFHKLFLRAGGYFVEIDTDADRHYDASGVGRIHKEGVPSEICLSIPFSGSPVYKTELQNPSSASICSFGSNVICAEGEYKIIKAVAEDGLAYAELQQKRGDLVFCEQISVSCNGVNIEASRDAEGIMVPVLEFDGANHSLININSGEISVEYGGGALIYSFDGELLEDFQLYANRNGRYRVYKIKGKQVKIELSEKIKFFQKPLDKQLLFVYNALGILRQQVFGNSVCFLPR